MATAKWKVFAIIEPKNNVKSVELKNEIKQISKYHKMKDFEIPKKIIVERDEKWSIDNGLLTITGKIKKSEILKRFQKKIDEIYL